MICDRFLYVFLKRSFNEKNDCFWIFLIDNFMLTIIKEGLSLTIVIETTNGIKTVAFGKTIVFWRKKYYMHLYWMSSYMRLNSCGRTKTSWYILKNYSIISTGDLQVGFLSSSTIVNEGSSLTIVNEATSFIKTIVSFSIFRRRFHNETIVFQKN